MKAKDTKLCNATFPNLQGGDEHRCGKMFDHQGKHDAPTGPVWNDEGEKLVRAEIVRKQECSQGF
jgi:hypothetical protein